MTKTLVIVESPGKILKIGQYLGPDYIVKASYGHVQDLDKSILSIDVENNFAPLYSISPDKTKIVKELRALAKECDDVILAADGDREGEAIAFSLASVLKLTNPKRIVFHEITKPALLNAVQNPTIINANMVHAQQARRLLDRLVGYQISPVLWKYIASNNGAKSAGRVQSVVVRIIIDKENEINKSISESYLKTTAEFDFDDKVKLKANLQQGAKLFHFETDENAHEFLEQINKKTEFKVDSVTNKKSIRKPSAPFITSSLQQEASTKLHFSVKKTMDVAQKLYEAGLITYMRSDSPNMSKEAIDDTKKYIISTYGKEYSDPKNYESKSANSQDAHECIRPTHMDNPTIGSDNANDDQSRLYDLIWKRATASQMSNAQVNVQTIQIDTLNNKQSILPLGPKDQAYWVSILENIEFPGYLTVYDNTVGSDDPITVGQLAIKSKDKLAMNNIKVCQEYTKPPLRYNEALLVKYLEKNGIGRPSTYASIISKVIERDYVEIKNIEGTKVQSKQISLDCKFKINESSKEVSIGNEQKKMVPTSMGEIVNDFMMKYFEPIMDIEFTSNLETYLDKIAEGKANWVTVLRTFYDMFSPIVEKLNLEAKVKKETLGSSNDKLLGTGETGQEIFSGSGKYGPYVKMQEDGKWKYASLNLIDPNKVTIEQAIELLEYPKTLGKISNTIVTLNKGQYGMYLKYGGKNITLKDKDINPKNITLEYAKSQIESGDPYALKTFKVKDKVLSVKKGDFGPYIQIVSGTKKQFISIPPTIDISTITIDQVLKIVADKNGTTKTKTTKKSKNINL